MVEELRGGEPRALQDIEESITPEEGGTGMKAKELMIGDLINGFGVVRRVTGIHGLERPEDDGLLTTTVPGCEFPESNLSFRPCYARPIPLTEEILEKNGFEELMSEGEEVAAMFA